MDEIKNAYWVEISERLGESPHTRRTEHWIQLDPPAHAWRCEFLAHGSGWSYDVVTDDAHLHTASTWKDSTLMRTPRPVTEKDLLNQVWSPRIVQAAAAGATDDGSGWRISREEQNGASLLRCEAERIRDNFQTSYVVWLDPQSGRHVKRESREIDLRTNQSLRLERCDNFMFNIDLDPSVFQMPAGRPIVDRSNHELFPGFRDEVPEATRQAVREVIDRSDAGWRTRDPDHFAAAWRFNTDRQAPKKSDWMRLLHNNAGLWSEWSTEIETFGWWKGISIQVGSNTFSLSGGKGPITLMARGKISVVWADDGQEWSGQTEFFLRKLWGRWRIVHWELPLEEIKAAHRNKNQ